MIMRALAVACIVCLAMAILPGCSSSAETLTLDDDGARVALSEGDTIEVALDGNATTGFSWVLVEFDDDVVAVEGDPAYEVEDTELVGVGGTWTWVLVARQPGETIVRFAYQRSWEDEPPEATFSFTASVSD